MSDDESQLRDQFQGLKQEDERAAPSFQATWRTDGSRPLASRPWFWVAIAAPASAIVVLVAAQTLRSRPLQPFAVAARHEITASDNPLEFLLEAPDNSRFTPSLPMPPGWGSGLFE
ncbi:MAG: hypothetical protein HY901_13540 [Deltaproteobacteria bacterium]|nr:hypothetical protein [Deltaproteobacteria bacterium]